MQIKTNNCREQGRKRSILRKKRNKSEKKKEKERKLENVVKWSLMRFL